MTFAFICKMRWIFLGLISFFFIHFTQINRRLESSAKITQSFCVDSVRRPSEYSSLTEAYLCGREIPDGKIKTLFCTTSLYHLVVVSGSHILVLIFILRKLALRESLITLLLFPYAIMTGMAPPIFRAFVQRVLGALSQHCRLAWKKNLCLLWAGLFCLCIFPEWIHSAALQLSLGCSVAIALAQLVCGRKWIMTSILSFLLLSPLLWGWAQVHPLGILTNFVLAPILSVGLWISSLVSVIFLPVGDFLFSLMIQSLDELAKLMPLELHDQTLSELQRWEYIVILCASLWAFSIRRQRQKLVVT